MQKNYANSKEKVQQEKYSKTFKNFMDGFNQMAALSGEIDSMIGGIEGTLGHRVGSVDEAASAAMQIYLNNMPSFENRTNMHFDIQQSANRTLLKTDKWLSFGWIIKSEITGEGTYEYTYIFMVVLHGSKHSELSSLLKENEWEIRE